MKVAAPGKIILAGEHAVVYGGDALAIAVDRYVTTTITKENRPGILFEFADLNHRSHVNGTLLKVLKAKIRNKYQRFKQGDFSIRKVLRKPFELAQFAFGTVTETLNLSFPHGIKIHIQSDIPVGCGMGSSAATIVSVMYAISQYSQRPLMDDELFKLALDAENMQHGASSGIDLRIALSGGCAYFNKSELCSRQIPQWPLYLVNTGRPLSSTGQCVEHASSFLNTGMVDSFSAVTRDVDAALSAQSLPQFIAAIRRNHRLLVQIGVVPERIQEFIKQVEERNGAAKICGAGAISGEAAGMVLIAAEDVATIKPVCSHFGYEVFTIAVEKRGVHGI